MTRAKYSNKTSHALVVTINPPRELFMFGKPHTQSWGWRIDPTMPELAEVGDDGCVYLAKESDDDEDDLEEDELNDLILDIPPDETPVIRAPKEEK